ncbi:MAG: DUF5119 domain-containing protein [Bacteroidaceae bacterium]|nr:DUF5119 domain-containing protein [Bacteroidaceae bacterium]
MVKTLWLAFMTAILAVNTACERKDLYLRVDQVDVSIAIYDIQLELLWSPYWSTELNYDWLAEYGYLGYPEEPELVRGTVYSLDSITKKKISSFYNIFSSKGGRVSLTTGSSYDMLFYNFGTEWTLFQQDENFEFYNATTRASSLPSWIRTRSESEDSEMPDMTTHYIDYNQPDVLFGCQVQGLYVSDDPDDYEKIVEPDGSVVYLYRVNAILDPYTFIYVFQFIVKNNYDENGQIITGARGMTVTGLAQGVDLFTRKTFTNTISISSEEIKPLQTHAEIKLPDYTDSFAGDIFACRMLTWGLPGIDPMAELKKGGPVEVLDKNYVGVGVTLRNGATYTITRDVTEQMHKRPTGGVITIILDGGAVPEKYLEPVPQPGGGGFNAKVEDWQNEVEAEVTI